MLKVSLFLFQILFVSVNCLWSQTEKSDIEGLQSLASQLYDKHPDSMKYEINSKVEFLLTELLEKTRIGDVAVDTLKFLKALHSEDGTFRMISWAYPLSDNMYDYSGFLQLFDNNGFHDSFISLGYKNSNDNVKKVLPTDEWPGAVYYKLIEKTSGKTKTYALLGWVGDEVGKSKRMIEVLDFDDAGTPYFGKPVFVMDEGNIQARVIFEYAEEVPLHLKYEMHPLPGKKKKAEMIVFNRLVGNNPQMGRMYKAMVPDYSTFDGLIFEDGKWVLHQDLDLRVNTDDLNRKPPKEAGGLAPSGK
jgi:hypothetical protein